MRHAFRVASGLDSMVLGETQIVGQMKDAVRAAGEAGSLGTLLHQMFQRTFSVARKCGRRPPSARSPCPWPRPPCAGRARVRRPGPGPHAVHRRRRDDRTLRHALRRATPAQHGRGQSHGRARRAAGQSFLGQHHEAVGPDRPLVRIRCDRVLYGQLLPILGLGMVERHAAAPPPPDGHDRRPCRAISNPKSAAGRRLPVFGGRPGPLVQTGTDARRAAVVQAEAIIETRVQGFMHWMQSREVVPVIRDLHQPPRTCAPPNWSARAACWRAANRPKPCWSSWPTA